jgi:hypothetical protein
MLLPYWIGRIFSDFNNGVDWLIGGLGYWLIGGLDIGGE